MYCPKCGNRMNNNDRFCPKCGNRTGTGQAARQPVRNEPVRKNNAVKAEAKRNKIISRSMIIGASCFAAILVIVAVYSAGSQANGKQTEAAGIIGTASAPVIPQQEEAAADFSETSAGSISESGQIEEMTAMITAFERPSLLGEIKEPAVIEADVPAYQVDDDFSNIYNYDQFYMSDQFKESLKNNLFYIQMNESDEFFEIYEKNRYNLVPNFITTDSMMHTYHLYFSHLLKNTERDYLCADLGELAAQMLQKSEQQYETLKGTEWEEAALINTAFFAVGASLLNPETPVPEYVQELVSQELSLIAAKQGITASPLASYGENPSEEYEDYSQYIVRGYYEGDARLEAYFQAMMWFGRMNFPQNDETRDRCALLMTLALDEDTLPLWSAIYTVTSFFAGASDDCGYYEYKPVLNAAYGENVTAADLPGNTEGWEFFHQATAQMPAPKINSVFADTNGDLDTVKGFRFMGQRFSVDAAVFQQLIYQQVGANAEGEFRMLPDALDVPSAMGSDTAYSILQQKGDTDYKGYTENMASLRTDLSQAPETLWNASLYSKWLDTLRPLLNEDRTGYPQFMQSNAWTRKDLQSFLGSYAELKHDTVLYSKQVMSEMGGGDIPNWDDRGYVEPEPVLFAKLADMTQATADGLAGFGMLSQEDAENLARLSELASSLQIIAEKELRNETPTEEEFELIRGFGGSLEHFWQDAYKSETDAERLTSREFPSAVVTDIATDPTGSVLEVGVGKAGGIYVIVPVDGQLKIAKGAVYSFYQFEQPISERLTDSEWRTLIGVNPGPNGYSPDPAYTPEFWTEDFQGSRNRY